MSTAVNEPAEQDAIMDRVGEVIKSANDLLTESQEQLATATEKLAAVDKDNEIAEPVCDKAFEKLCGLSIGGQKLIPDHLRSDWESHLKTKEGMASMIDQLTDVISGQTESQSKTAGELGGAATDVGPYGSALDTASGLAAVRRPMRM